MNDIIYNLEQKINKRKKDYEDSRDVLNLKEKQSEEGSAAQFSFNASAARLTDVIYELDWLMKNIKEEKEKLLFPNCLDYIQPENKAK